MKPTTESGFTMVEVMIAVLLSAIAVIGLVGLYTVESRAATMSRRKTEAAVLAQDKIEELRTMVAPSAAGTGSEPYVDEHGNLGSNATPPFIFARSWELTAQGIPAGEWYRIKVTVTWEGGSVIVYSERQGR